MTDPTSIAKAEPAFLADYGLDFLTGPGDSLADPEPEDRLVTATVQVRYRDLDRLRAVAGVRKLAYSHPQTADPADLLKARQARGLAPMTPIEAMLATQVVELHHAFGDALARATGGGAEKHRQAWASLAVRLASEARQQALALARLQGNGADQTVRVEHVTVADGGQAIIGHVERGDHGE